MLTDNKSKFDRKELGMDILNNQLTRGGREYILGHLQFYVLDKYITMTERQHIFSDKGGELI